MPDAKFRVSSALKSIIGGELITDDFIAIFELVKNSFDAHAKNVEVRFENLGNPRKAQITIADDGKGMTAEDLERKWLHVAYSAKRNNTEDIDLSSDPDYRDAIKQAGAFAGAKGIGRFSCDRLGRYLLIFTRREAETQRFDWLKVDWRKFERDDRERFEDVRVAQGTSKKDHGFKLRHGTVLRITGLKSNWNREKLLVLRAGLQKLINPGPDSKERTFRINIVAPDEDLRDRQEKDARKRVNGDVANFLFEKLGIKTTQITCSVDQRGKTVTTELRDRGILIYRLVELNTKFQELKNIEISLFYLNRAAKVNFRKVMGMQPVQFGSVFLFKNGFRVQPYGKEGDDGFGLDRRKQQGSSRYLGTRDLLGRLEIQADNRRFKEVSSRDGGLQNSPEVAELMDFFHEYPLRRLETYVIDVIRWGQPPKGSDLEEDAIQPGDVRSEILELVKGLTDASEVVEFESDPDVVRIVTERQAEGAAGLLSNLERMAESKNNPELAKEARRIRREMSKALAARATAQKAMEKERGLRVLQERQLEAERGRNQFLKNLVSPAAEQKEILQHWVKVVSERIRGTAEKAMAQVRRGAENSTILEELAAIVRDSSQLATVSELVSNGGFGVKKTKITGDIARYAFEYLNELSHAGGVLRHQIAYDSSQLAQIRFQPVDVAIVFDNIISNAKKAGAHSIEWRIGVEPRTVRISVSNDGKALNDKVQASLFELGTTTTGGSGLGLYTCRKILRAMGGDITFVGNDKRLGGPRFEIVVPL